MCYFLYCERYHVYRLPILGNFMFPQNSFRNCQIQLIWDISYFFICQFKVKWSFIQNLKMKQKLFCTVMMWCRYIHFHLHASSLKMTEILTNMNIKQHVSMSIADVSQSTNSTNHLYSDILKETIETTVFGSKLYLKWFWNQSFPQGVVTKQIYNEIYN